MFVRPQGSSDSFSAHQVVHDDAVTFEPATTAVIVIDMVNDFCSEGGSMVLPNSERVYPAITRLTEKLRASGSRIVWVRDEHEPGDIEFRKRSVHCLSGSWGAQLVASFTPHLEDSVRPKNKFSAFFETDLHEWLQAQHVSTLVLCGVVTNICVRSTAHDAFFRGYNVIVAEDACAATSEREQASTLYDIETHFGRVATVDQLTSQRPMESR